MSRQHRLPRSRKVADGPPPGNRDRDTRGQEAAAPPAARLAGRPGRGMAVVRALVVALVGAAARPGAVFRFPARGGGTAARAAPLDRAVRVVDTVVVLATVAPAAQVAGTAAVLETVGMEAPVGRAARVVPVAPVGRAVQVAGTVAVLGTVAMVVQEVAPEAVVTADRAAALAAVVPPEQAPATAIRSPVASLTRS